MNIVIRAASTFRHSYTIIATTINSEREIFHITLDSQKAGDSQKASDPQKAGRLTHAHDPEGNPIAPREPAGRGDMHSWWDRFKRDRLKRSHGKPEV